MDVYVLDEHVVEVVADQGVEVTPVHIEQMLEFVARMTREPRGLLANRKHHYSFTFSAMGFIAKRDDFRAVAVVTYGRVMPYVSRALKPLNCSIAFFENRDKALGWLGARLKG